MPITLIAFDTPPTRIAVSKTGGVVPDGRFFLDFTRKIKITKWLIIKNKYIGITIGALFPVAHEAEISGGFVIGVEANDQYFYDIRKLWKERYPSAPLAIGEKASGIKIISDFANQFPEDCT